MKISTPHFRIFLFETFRGWLPPCPHDPTPVLIMFYHIIVCGAVSWHFEGFYLWVLVLYIFQYYYYHLFFPLPAFLDWVLCEVFGTRMQQGPGRHSTFFGGCVPHRFPKVGSREWIFLEKWGVLRTKIRKICILRAEILTKTRLKMENFSKIWKWGGTRAVQWW